MKRSVKQTKAFTLMVLYITGFIYNTHSMQQGMPTAPCE